MNKPTKKEQKDEVLRAYDAIIDPAHEAYKAIRDPAYKAYQAKVKAIEAQPDEPDEPEETITHNGRKYRLIKD